MIRACSIVVVTLLVGCGDDDGPAPMPDAGFDAGPMQDAGSADAGDIVCLPSGVDRFRSFDRGCTTAADCAVVVLQVDCCGSLLATGINSAGVADFEAAAMECAAMYPDCDCPAMQPRADDGSNGADPTAATVQCMGMACRSGF